MVLKKAKILRSNSKSCFICSALFQLFQLFFNFTSGHHIFGLIHSHFVKTEAGKYRGFGCSLGDVPMSLSMESPKIERCRCFKGDTFSDLGRSVLLQSCGSRCSKMSSSFSSTQRRNSVIVGILLQSLAKRLSCPCFLISKYPECPDPDGKNCGKAMQPALFELGMACVVDGPGWH